MDPTIVDSYDGQSIYIHHEARYSIGNYLGGGIAGVVYEAHDHHLAKQLAIKILNPIGYKLMSPLTLKKYTLVHSGVRCIGAKQGSFSLEHVSWLVHPPSKQFVAAYLDAHGQVFELPLSRCVEIWGRKDLDEIHGIDNEAQWAQLLVDQDPLYESSLEKEEKGDGEESGEEGGRGRATRRTSVPKEVLVNGQLVCIPRISPKYLAFLKNRKSIYREIAHMHKLTGNGKRGQLGGVGHENILKLHNVLELTQTSKSTIFLVLELATGGELFDRIGRDCGMETGMACGYFRQLLSGVSYCHQLGIVRCVCISYRSIYSCL